MIPPNKIQIIKIQQEIDQMLEIGKKQFDILNPIIKGSGQISAFNSSQNSYRSQYIYRNSLYLYTWPQNCSILDLKKNDSLILTQLKIDKQSLYKQGISQYKCHNSSLLNNQIHFLAFKKQQFTSNIHQKTSDQLQLVKFNINNGVYQLIQTSGNKPSIKQYSIMHTINNMYIILYGVSTQQNIQNEQIKINIQEQKVQNKQKEQFNQQAYALVFRQWKKLKIVNPIKKRTHFSSTICNGKIYIHGGQIKKDCKTQYLSDLYALTFSDTKNELSFETIVPQEGPKPKQRSNHKMISINSRYLLIYGGYTQMNEQVQKDSQHNSRIQEEQDQQRHQLKDMWLFDIVSGKWQQVNVNTQKYNCRKLVGLQQVNNYIYLIGNFQFQDSKKHINYIKLELSQILSQNQIYKKYQINPELQIKQKKMSEKLYGQRFQFPTTLIHSSSFSIRTPFQAIQRVIQFAQLLHSKQITIKAQATNITIQKFLYISFDFKHSDELTELNSKELELQIQKLFIYCLRIGKTILYVHNNKAKRCRNVYFISADGKYAPSVQKIQLFYKYTENYDHQGNQQLKNHKSNQNEKQKQIYTEQDYGNQQHNKNTIIRILDTMIMNGENMIKKVDGSKILIFSPNIIPTPKTYFYELVFQGNDVGTFKNNKKIQMIQNQLKYNLSNTMEYSLTQYLKYSKSNKNKLNINHNSKDFNKDMDASKQQQIKIYINSSTQEPVCQNKSYQQILQEYSISNKLIKLPLSTSISLSQQINQNQTYQQYKLSQIPSIKHVQSVQLYACLQDFYLPENNGILLYQNNKLINRYECQFGQLVAQKLYQKKFINNGKHPNNLFNIVGQIHISNQLKLINYNTQLQKTNKSTQFKISLQKAILQSLKIIEPQLREHHVILYKREKKQKVEQHKIQTNQNSLINNNSSIINNFSNIGINNLLGGRQVLQAGQVKRGNIYQNSQNISEQNQSSSESSNNQENSQNKNKKVKLDSQSEYNSQSN